MYMYMLICTSNLLQNIIQQYYIHCRAYSLWKAWHCYIQNIFLVLGTLSYRMGQFMKDVITCTRSSVLFITVGDHCIVSFLWSSNPKVYDLCQQPHHLVQICLSEWFLGGAKSHHWAHLVFHVLYYYPQVLLTRFPKLSSYHFLLVETKC